MALQVWMPLDGNLVNQCATNTQVINNGATINNNGKIGKCYSFNGSSNKLTVPLQSASTSPVGSIACWVKMNSLPGNSSFYTLIQIGSQGGYASCMFGMYMEYANKINISINGSTTNQNVYIHSMVKDTWYHLCATFDGTIVKLYIDGVEVLSKSATKGSYVTSSSNMFVGGTSSYWLNGYMNDVRYYDHVLSAKEVRYLSQGLILHYPLDNNGLGQENLILNSLDLYVDKLDTDTGARKEYWAANTGSSYSDFAGGEKVVLSFDIEMIVRTLPVSLTVYNTNNKGPIQFPTIGAGGQINKLNPEIGDTVSTRIVIPATLIKRNDPTTQNNFIEFYTTYGSNNYYKITNIKMEMGSEATPYSPAPSELSSIVDDTLEYDTSGYNRHGVRSSIAEHSSDTPLYFASTYFESYNNGITGNAGVASPNAVTMSIWIKSLNKSPRGSYHVPFNCHATKYEISIRNPGTVRFGFYISGQRYVNDIAAGVLDGEWHMLTHTYDGHIMKQYIDGELVGSQEVDGSLTEMSSVGVGRFPGGTTYGSTEMYQSDARFYTTALSEADIMELYNLKMSIASDNTFFAREYVEAEPPLSMQREGVMRVVDIEEDSAAIFDGDGVLYAREIIEI